MRVLILTLALLGILVGADNAKAGLSTTNRDLSVSADPAAPTDEAPAVTDEATQATEDQIGLDKAKRRHVQRWLTRLGFDTKVDGKFDESTRAVIARWQAARGYPGTGFLNATQHQALLAETVSSARADSGSSDSSDDDHPPRHGGGGHRRGDGGPVGLIGHMVGGLFGRR